MSFNKSISVLSYGRNVQCALLLVIAIFLAGLAWAEESAPVSPDSEPEVTLAVHSDEEPASVAVWNRTIMDLRASFKGKTPADRAKRAVARIETLPAEEGIEILTINASTDSGVGIMLSTASGVLFTILPGDIDPASGETLEDVAEIAAAQLRAVLDERAEQLKLPNLLHGAGIAGATTLVYILIVWGVVRFKKTISGKVDQLVSRWHRPISVADVDLLPAIKVTERIVIHLLFLAVIISATYMWIVLCCAQFFFSQPWASLLDEYLVIFFSSLALAIVHAIPGILTVLVIFWLTRIVTAGVSRFFLGVEKRTIYVGWLQRDSARASRRIVIVGIWLFALILAYPYIPGSESAAFKGISVFAGVILSLGSTTSVSHLMGGLVIAYSGAISVGDYISIGSVEGTVIDLGPLSTKLKTTTREYITIPNGVMLNSHTTNYSRFAGKDGAMASTVITIGYDVPWRQVHALLIAAADGADGVRKTPQPFVLQRALSDFYVEYELRFYMNRPQDRRKVLSSLHALIQDAFNDAGVQIMSPNFVAQPEQPVLAPKAQ